MTHKEQERVKMGINDDGLGAHSVGRGILGQAVCRISQYVWKLK